MAYKHIEIISGYSVPGRGIVFLTLDRTTKVGEIIEVNGKIWRVVSVEVSDVAPHAGLVVTPFTESEAKQVTAREAKSLLDAIFSQQNEGPALSDPQVINPGAEVVFTNPVVGPIMADQPAKTPVATATDEQKKKLIRVLETLNEKIREVRDWTLNRLGEFDLGKEPPSVMVLVVSMPQAGMEAYLQQMEKFLVHTMESLEKEGKLTWANVKAVAGVKN